MKLKKTFQTRHIIGAIGMLAYVVGFGGVFLQFIEALKSPQSRLISDYTLYELRFVILMFFGLGLTLLDNCLFGYQGIWPDPKIEKEEKEMIGEM